MFYVYYGYCSHDNCDTSEGPTYKIKECLSVDDVTSFRKQFDDDLNEYCGNIIFRVFEGKERFLTPKTTVESYDLS